MPTETVAIDDLDQEIIKVLQDDGRMSFGEIGRRVGLSEAAARQRVHRMRRDGVIKIMAFADPVALGLRRAAMLLIDIDGDLSAAAKKVAAHTQVEFVAITGGLHDLIVEVQCEDESQMLALINEIRQQPQVRLVRCLNYFHVEKQDFGFLLHDRSTIDREDQGGRT